MNSNYVKSIDQCSERPLIDQFSRPVLLKDSEESVMNIYIYIYIYILNLTKVHKKNKHHVFAAFCC